MEKKNVNTNLVAALLVVIAVLGYGLIGKAGNLEPSSAPAPTMKTLDEVEPRIPISQSDIPKTIDASGSYYFTEDVTAAGTAITVTVDDVTIDLMGYTLKGPDSGTNYGIYMNERRNVEIRNGTVRDFTYGIYESNGTYGQAHRVIDVRAVSNGQRGIYLEGISHLVKDCTASDNGYSANSNVYGIYASQGCTIIGNRAYRNGAYVTGSSCEVYGIRTSLVSTVTGNTVYNNGDNATGSYVFGIFAGGCCMVTDNISCQNGTLANSIVYGISAYNGSTVTGNTVYGNGGSATGDNIYGIFADDGSTMTGNTVYANGDSAESINVYGICTPFGSTMTGNTSSNNGNSANSNVYGIFANSGSTVTGNTANNNGSSATGNVFGIFLVGDSLVDQNTAYGNNGTNMYDIGGSCTFGTNHAP